MLRAMNSLVHNTRRHRLQDHEIDRGGTQLDVD